MSVGAYGLPEKEIARVLGVEPSELRLAFPDELDTGSTTANSKVASRQAARKTAASRRATETVAASIARE